MKIGLIGTEDQLAGFGLAGMDKMWQIQEKPTVNQIKIILSEAKKEGFTALFVSEEFLNYFQKEKDLFFIPLPDKEGNGGIEKIEKLTKEILGITI